MRVLVCGGRDWTHLSKIFNMLFTYYDQTPLDEEFVVIQGGAIGADFIAKIWALSEGPNRVGHEEYKAQWDKYGQKAGPIRNKRMLDEGKPDIILAFPTKDSAGTWDLINQASDRDIEIFVVKEGEQT